ncbi:MAG: O-antigen ligase family protein [Bacteriovoracaceae bacterium]|nr:O-antigen ligase family protein [Bacteriovoracaceae bacterium]
MNLIGLDSLGIHQIFFAILCACFAFFAYRDLDLIKERNSLDSRRFIALLLGTTFIGLVAIFYDGWKGEGLLFCVEFAFLICVSFISPKFAVSFFLYLLLSRPWESFDNALMESMPRDIFYFVVLVILGHKVAKKQWYFRFNLGSLLLCAFAVWVFLSAVTSSHISAAIQNYNEVFLKGVIIYLLIQNSFEKAQDLLPAKIALALAVLEKSVISLTVSSGDSQRLESVGILGNSNDIAAIFILAMPFILFTILKTRLRPFSWFIAFFSVLAMSYLVWQSQSRGAMLALFICFASYGLVKFNSKKLLGITAAVAVLLALISFQYMNRGASDLGGSTDNRIIFWKAGANMTARNPLFGVGFWGFNDNFAGYAIDGKTGSEGRHMTAHSSWVQVSAETGILGLMLFLGLWIDGFIKAWRIRKTDPEYIMSIVGYGVAVSFLSHAYMLFPYVLLSLTTSQFFVSDIKKK